MDIQALLKFCVQQKATDLHLQPHAPVNVRIGGQMRSVEGVKLEAEALASLIRQLLSQSAEPTITPESEPPERFMSVMPEIARVRVSTVLLPHGPSITLRFLPLEPPTTESLGLPAGVRDLLGPRRGLTLIVGPDGSGRSTTLASLVQTANRDRSIRIVTLDNPIEYEIRSDRAIVTQMHQQPGLEGLERGLVVARTLSADLVAIGRLSLDADTLGLTLEAVEAGMQVIAVASGSSTIQTLIRTLDALPSALRSSYERRLATCLEAMIALRTASTRDGQALSVVEFLRGGQLTRELILSHRLDDLARIMAGRQGGMQDFDQQLLELYRAGRISGTEAIRLASNPEELAASLQSRVAR